MAIKAPDQPFVYTVVTLSVIGLFLHVVSILHKVLRQFPLPKLWKFSYITLDVAHICLCIGLLLFIVFKYTGIQPVCDSAGFFIQFSVLDCVCAFLIAGIILLGIYNPGKSTYLSKFHRNVFLVIFIPQKVISILLSALPFILNDYFYDKDLTYAVTCLKIRQSDERGGTVGILTFLILWITIIISLAAFVISVIKLRKGFNNRIHSSSSNVWQTQFVTQGKTLQRILITGVTVWGGTLVVVNTLTYVDDVDRFYSTWIVYITFSVISVVQGVLSMVGNVMWSTCCCFSTREVEEPHRKLKKLELVKFEAPGKLRLRALWNVTKTGGTRRGLMKVYGPSHLKEWAQEIVVLGMLRKAQHPSLLQCLWTSSSNPYYETMTLITGEIITSDSRIICLELTNSGTLHDLLRRNEVSLPETCQRMIVHDVAEGLFYLHSQNVLHNNLNTSSIYLKGSLPNMVMRAAIGDFEDTQIYGSLQQNGGESSTTAVTKRQFFLPDIRSFALIALEIVSKMCERRFLSMQYDWDCHDDPNIMVNNIPSAHADGRTRRLRGVVNEGYSDDSDYEEQQISRRNNVIYSPYELIEEEKRRRSRSHSPGSRPLSAQSRRSNRSRTHSPDLSRWHNDSPATQTIYNGRSHTPEFDKHPDSGRALSPISKGHISNRNLSPEPSSRPMSPNVNDKKKEKSKKSKSKHKDTGSQAFEVVPPSPRKSKSLKKTDSKKLLSKPVSLLKNLTGAETTVSAFKPKHSNENEGSASEISDEEIETMRDRFKMSHKMRQDSKNSLMSESSLHRTVSQKSDQWSIRSDMEYRHNGLKNTVSADSRSSLWSNLPLPLETIDVERDELDNIIDQLPGMTNSLDERKNPSISEMLNARDRARHIRQYWQNDGPGTRTFELVDYYDEIQGKYVKKLLPIQHRSSLGAGQVGGVQPVHRTFSGTQVLHRTTSGLQEIMEGTEEEDDGNRHHECSEVHTEGNSPKKIKAKLIKEEQAEATKELKKKSTKKKTKSAKSYAAPQPPPSEEALKTIALEREESERIRSKARNKLVRALSGKGQRPSVLQRTNSRNEIIDVKVASVRKLQVQSNRDQEMDNEVINDKTVSEQCDTQSKDQFLSEGSCRLYVPANRKEAIERKFPPDKLSKSEVKRYSSFSSNDSYSSIGSSVRVRRGDVSLTSGELTSLSSQADPDTDEMMTDVEFTAKEAYLRKLVQQKKGIVDSGFDSESDISSDVHGHHSSTYLSDDSAFHDGKDTLKQVKKMNNLQKAEAVSTVSIPSSNFHLSEKAFCLTGINSGVPQEKCLPENDSPELDVEYLPDKDTLLNDALETRPTSSMSRIIEVSSASPDHTKDIEREEEMRCFSPKLVEQGPKLTALRPKTPSSNQRPKTPSLIRGPNVMASNPIDASRRYRELVKKGVPMRVSQVSADDTDRKSKSTPMTSRGNEAEEVNPEDEKLFHHLESEGFFKSHRENDTASTGGPYNTGNRKSRKDKHDRKRKPKLNKLNLDDIIREIPEDTSPSPGQRSPRPNPNLLSPSHAKANLDDSFNVSENEVAMINQPSEESETTSVQNSSVVNSTAPSVVPHNQPAVVLDAELYIDRIYSHNQETKGQPPQLLDPDFDSPLLAGHSKLLRTMSDFPMHGLSPLDEPTDQDFPTDIDVPLLVGMNDTHVEKCRRLTSSLHLVSFSDLLPATPEGLDMLKAKLFQGGQLGNIGSQIVDIANKCWISEIPPTSFDLVMQLMDPVTETEL